MVYIGIDTGVHTGIAVWNSERKEFDILDTMKIHEAMNFVYNYAEYLDIPIHVRFEDARQRKWIPISKNMTAELGRAQGAGYVKAHCQIWEDYLTDYQIPFEAIAPRRNVTKLSAEQFGRITGYKGRTSEHARDAAMLVYGL